MTATEVIPDFPRFADAIVGGAIVSRRVRSLSLQGENHLGQSYLEPSHGSGSIGTFRSKRTESLLLYLKAQGGEGIWIARARRA